ncbi:MAG: hypothetical protein JRN20_01325 [Nitrososphaerota archaeon]|jgi:hypothetical protein|nr:hypothetical protein [Nitrososphaerota archaeon]
MIQIEKVFIFGGMPAVWFKCLKCGNSESATKFVKMGDYMRYEIPKHHVKKNRLGRGIGTEICNETGKFFFICKVGNKFFPAKELPK